MMDSRSGFRWSNFEDEIIKEFVRRNGHVKPKLEEWIMLANDSFGGKRSADQLLNRWTYVIEPGITKGPWTYEEDQIIISSKIAGINKWSEISKQLPGRAGKQIRERWQNHLDPDLKKSRWTIEEDITLYQSQQNYGNHWNLITANLPGRSENSIKNRWHSASFKKNIANIASTQTINHFDSDTCRNPYHTNNQDITSATSTTISTTIGSVSSTENNDDDGTTNLLRLNDKRKSMNTLITDHNSNSVDQNNVKNEVEGGDAIRYMTRSLSLKSLPSLPSGRKMKQSPKAKNRRKHTTEYTQHDNMTSSYKSVRDYFRNVCNSVTSTYSYSQSQNLFPTKSSSRSRSSSSSNSRRKSFSSSIATYFTPCNISLPNMTNNNNEIPLSNEPLTPLATEVTTEEYSQNDKYEPGLQEHVVSNSSIVKSPKFHSLQNYIELFNITGNDNRSINNNNSVNLLEPTSDKMSAETTTTTTTTTSVLHISPMNKLKAQSSFQSQWPLDENAIEQDMIQIYDNHKNNNNSNRYDKNIEKGKYEMEEEEEETKEDNDTYLLDFQIQSGDSFSMDMLSMDMENQTDKELEVFIDKTVDTTVADDDINYSVETTADSTFNGRSSNTISQANVDHGFLYTNNTINDLDISCNISKNSSSDFQFLSLSLSLSHSIDDDLKGKDEEEVEVDIVSMETSDGGDEENQLSNDLYGKLDTSSSMLSRDLSEVELRDYFNNKWSAEDLRLLTFDDDDDENQAFFF